MNGFERLDQPGKRVIIIGAGHGRPRRRLRARAAGHDPLILEAQNRVGGRVYTLRKFAPGLYAEAGAMRIPRVHDLTLGYCERFGLELRPFLMGNPKGLVHVGGQRMTAEQAGLDPDELRLRRGRPRARALVRRRCGTTPRRDLRALARRPTRSPAGRASSASTTSYTLREFLEVKGFSEGAIEMYGVMNFVEADMNNAVVEEFREDFGRAFEDMQEIVGGMDNLPNAFYARAPGPRPVRRRGPRDRAGRRLGHRPLQDRVRAATRSRGDYAICRASRSPCSARSRS